MKLLEKYWLVLLGLFAVVMYISPGSGIILAGCALLILIAYSVWALRKIERNGITTDGYIIHELSEDNLHVEFTTSLGEVLREAPYFTTSVDSNFEWALKRDPNNPLTICYDPDDPRKFIIVNETERLYTTSIVFAAVAVVLIIAGICCLLGHIKFN